MRRGEGERRGEKRGEEDKRIRGEEEKTNKMCVFISLDLLLKKHQ